MAHSEREKMEGAFVGNLPPDVADRNDDARHSIGGNNPPPEFSLSLLIDGLPDQLAAEFSEAIAAKIGPIAERANAMPVEFTSDDDLAKATDIANDAADAWDALDAQRKAKKDPFKRGGEIVDDFHREPLTRLKRIKDAFVDRATKYTREKKRKVDAAAQAERDRLARIAEENRIAAEAAAAFGDDDEAEKRTQIAETVEVRAEDVAPEVTEPVRGSSGGTAGTRKDWTFEILDFEKVDLNAIRPFVSPDAIEKALAKMAKQQKHLAKVEGVRFFEDERAAFRRR